MARMIDLVNAEPQWRISSSVYLDPTTSAGTSAKRAPLLPVFITCDPARDTPAVLKAYLKEFHPGIVGVTGPWEAIKDVCKKYRVYFSTPRNVKSGDDYLVDHSIYFYLMGELVHLYMARRADSNRSGRRLCRSNRPPALCRKGCPDYSRAYE